MDTFLGWVWSAIVALLTVIFTGAGIMAVRDEGWTGRGIAVLVLACAIVITLVRLLKPNRSTGRAVLTTLAVVGGVALALEVGADQRTDVPDEVLRREIIGTWRVLYRMTAKDRGMTLPEDADFIFQGNEEVVFGKRTVRIKGEYIISVVSRATGSHECRLDSSEFTRWRIQDGTLTLTPMRGMTKWAPKPGHAPTRAFLKRFPMPEPDHEPREFHIKSLSRTKLVALLISKNLEGKTIRNELVFHRVS